MTRGAREPMASHLAQCRGCRRAASNVVRSGVAMTECCWCGAVYFADGRLSPRRVPVADPTPSRLAPNVAGDVQRSPW